MEIWFNGDKESLNDSVSLASFLEAKILPAAFAVSLNENFVPRSLYPETILSEGDRIECLSPIQGG